MKNNHDINYTANKELSERLEAFISARLLKHKQKNLHDLITKTLWSNMEDESFAMATFIVRSCFGLS